jgi:hypothetical protein
MMTLGTSADRRISEVRGFARAVAVATATCAAFATPASADISTCAELCPASGSYCPVENRVDVVPGSYLDCAGKDIFIRDPSGNIYVTGGTFALRANNLSVLSGHRIIAIESATVQTGFEIDVAGDASIGGTLQARNRGGGSHVYIRSGDELALYGTNPVIDVSGDLTSCDGGIVMLESGGLLDIHSRIDANGKDGGSEENANSGGYVELTSAANVRVYEEIRAFGRFFDGGVVDILALGEIEILNVPNTAAKGQIDAEGRNLDGYGGFVSLVSSDLVTVGGPIRAGGGMNVGGAYSRGGEVEVYAGCPGVLITNEIDVRGGSDDGGVVRIDSLGPVTLSGQIYAQSRDRGGNGGEVELVSGGLVKFELGSIVNVDGHNVSNEFDGDGGLVVVQACQVDVVDDTTTGAAISALGAEGGAILIEGAKTGLSTTGYSVKVGNKSSVNAAGTVTAGSIELGAQERRLGRCSNNGAATCQQSSECVYGCTTGTCTNPAPNPDTQDVITQFTPAPVVRQRNGLLPCEACN